MKTLSLVAALALGLGACRQDPTALANPPLTHVQQSARLRFAAACASVWDISVDGTDSGLLLFTGANQRYDAGAGAHLFSATRWAPGDIAVLEGAVPSGRDTLITLRCS